MSSQVGEWFPRHLYISLPKWRIGFNYHIIVVTYSYTYWVYHIIGNSEFWKGSFRKPVFIVMRRTNTAWPKLPSGFTSQRAKGRTPIPCPCPNGLPDPGCGDVFHCRCTNGQRERGAVPTGLPTPLGRWSKYEVSQSVPSVPTHAYELIIAVYLSCKWGEKLRYL